MTGLLELVMAFTHHAVPGTFNEVHPGLRYERAPVTAALYKNSEGRPSLFVAAIGRADAAGFSLFGELGVATGYSAAPIIPIARGGIELDNARLFVFPAINKNGEANIGLGLEVIAVRF